MAADGAEDTEAVAFGAMGRRMRQLREQLAKLTKKRIPGARPRRNFNQGLVHILTQEVDRLEAVALAASALGEGASAQLAAAVRTWRDGRLRLVDGVPLPSRLAAIRQKLVRPKNGRPHRFAEGTLHILLDEVERLLPVATAATPQDASASEVLAATLCSWRRSRLWTNERATERAVNRRVRRLEEKAAAGLAAAAAAAESAPAAATEATG